MENMARQPRLESLVSSVVDVRPHEIPVLIHSFACFFFILSAYFVILPLRDDGAISLGLDNLPGLFVGSLVLTLVAAPVSTLMFSLPNLPKGRALVLIHRFFSITLCVFFILWYASSIHDTSSSASFQKSENANFVSDGGSNGDWSSHGWFYISVRIGLFLWVALLNLVTISSTWARIIDVMDTESGSRLFGFVGAGATLGQLFGSLFAVGMAWLGPYLLLCSAILMEFASISAKGINHYLHSDPSELILISEDAQNQHNKDDHSGTSLVKISPNSVHTHKAKYFVMLDGLWLILSSKYLLCISMFIWLSAVISSFFYFQKMTIIALTISTPLGRRRMFAEINSFIAIFILVGQLTLTGRILTTAGITVAICSSPSVALFNLVALAMWPTWITVGISETIRKVVTYVITRPARELLFTVVSEDEKYKAKVCIDVIVQRLGDATAAGLYKLLFDRRDKNATFMSLYALPVCLLWIVTAIHLGRRHESLARLQNSLES